MEKESYSIDDILSEVKKRRENEGITPNFEIKQTDENGILPEEIIVDNEPDFKTVDAETKQEITDPEVVEEDFRIVNNRAPVDTEPEQKEVNNAVHEETETEEIVTEEASYEEPAEEAPEEEPSSQATQPDEAPQGFVDLLSIAEEAELEPQPEPEPEEKQKKAKPKKAKAIKAVIIILIIAIIGAGVFAGVYIKNALDSITDNSDAYSEDTTWAGMSQYIENFPQINETEASELSSLQDMIRTWYYNGAPCSSSHVLNVLFIGEDTRGEEILDDEVRADSAIIVSVNIDTKQITLTSVLRDSYAYWENVPGDETTGEFGKINSAMAHGGIKAYINAVEKLFKVDIDNYVIVNFDSFEGIIDELGGVDIEITSSEIWEINSNPRVYGNVYIEQTFEGKSGTMHLNGEQALAYCRIRHIDSDAVRADRQKTCLLQIFNKVQETSTVNHIKVVNKLIPYVKTGFNSNEVVSIAKYAISQGWLKFDINMLTVPNARINERGAGGTYYGAWCWKVDFPQDSNYLQTMLYGKSSVILAQQRVDNLNCNLYGFYSDTLTPCYATITNYSYGETTTYETTTEEESTSQTNQD